MTKARLLFISLFLALAVIVTYGVVAQPAAPAKASATAKPAATAQAASSTLPKVAKVSVNDPVTLTDNGDTWTMDNGMVKLTIRKGNGSIAELVYHGVSVLGRGGENWERTPGGVITAKVTIDPATNGGERAEVSVKGVGPGAPAGGPGAGGPGPGGPAGAAGAGGRGTGGRAGRGGGAAGAAGAGAPGAPGAAVAGAAGPGGAPGAGGRGAPGAMAGRGGGGGGRPGNGMDIETRYTLERGSSGFYTYAEYTHPASYPAAHVGEDRFILESMNPTFDWLSVDNDRNMLMSFARGGITIHAKEQSIYTSGIYKNSVEHKYTYNQDMYKLTAWGWSSTKDHIGVYFINPSNEYISGGPEKLDLIDHLQSTILDYWTSGHYGGGANTDIEAGQDWKRVVGPIFVYFDSLADPKDPSQADLDKLTATSGSGMPSVPKVWHDNALALWNDAVAKSKTVKAAWPYNWVQGMDYPKKAERGTVTGQLVLDDLQATKKTLPNLNVGLTHANYTGAGAGFQTRAGNGPIVTWPHDGDYYQFWTYRFGGWADSLFPMYGLAPMFCAPLPTECWANTTAPQRSRWKRARPIEPGQDRLAAGPLRQADMGYRLPRSHWR